MSAAALSDTSVEAALDQLATDFDHLLKLAADQVGGFDHTRLLGLFTGFEQFRNRLPQLDHLLIGAADAAGLPGAVCQPNLTRLLVRTLRLSGREATARVAAAEALGERTTMLGERLAPARPTLAAAQAAGTVNPDQVALIVRELGRVDRRGFDPAAIAAGERQLTACAAALDPRELAVAAHRVIDHIDPDGTLPPDRLNHDRRHLTLHRTRDGAYVGQFRLTGTVGAKLSALLDRLAHPRHDRLTLADHTRHDPPDLRSRGQRLHDALGELCDRTLRAGDTPGTGGTPATVIITLDADTLATRTGRAHTADGTVLSVADALRLANQADIIPTILTAAGAPLHLGRSRRIATHPQTLALIARDGGCSFPSCDRPPEWCERHHILDWADNGPTNLDNLTLLCTYHHHHFQQAGWTCEINPDRLPHWRPPAWIDPHRRPILNPRVGQHRRRE